jgi:hypothetical protein
MATTKNNVMLNEVKHLAAKAPQLRCHHSKMFAIAQHD